MRRATTCFSVHVLAIATGFLFGCGGPSSRAPNSPEGDEETPNPPAIPPPWGFDVPSVSIDQDAGNTYVLVRRNLETAPPAPRIRLLRASPRSPNILSSYSYCYQEPARDSAYVALSVTPTSVPSPPDTVWLTTDQEAQTPILDDPRFLRIALRTRHESVGVGPTELGLRAGRQWHFRTYVHATAVDGPDGCDSAREVVLTLGQGSVRDGVTFYPLSASHLAPIALSLGQSGTQLLATVPTDTVGVSVDILKRLRRTLEPSLPWVLGDLDDPPGTTRELANVELSLGSLPDTAYVSYVCTSTVLGRFDLSGPAGSFEGAFVVRIAVRERWFDWGREPAWNGSREITLALAPGVGPVRLAASMLGYDTPPYGHQPRGFDFQGNLDRVVDAR